MTESDHEDADILRCLSGTENDLNEILSTYVDSEYEIENFCDSRYIEWSNLENTMKNNGRSFSIISLNVQSINAKFDTLFPIVNNLSSMGLYFGAICLQETWLTSDANLSLFHIPGYKLIHQGRKCSKHGGLLIYLNEEYSYKIRDICPESKIWEGLFIDVTGSNLRRPITIGNIYRPPHDNNNNANVNLFNTELSPIVNKLQRENKYGAIVGDFNINLLQTSRQLQGPPPGPGK